MTLSPGLRTTQTRPDGAPTSKSRTASPSTLPQRFGRCRLRGSSEDQVSVQMDSIRAPADERRKRTAFVLASELHPAWVRASNLAKSTIATHRALSSGAPPTTTLRIAQSPCCPKLVMSQTDVTICSMKEVRCSPRRGCERLERRSSQCAVSRPTENRWRRAIRPRPRQNGGESRGRPSIFAERLRAV